MEEILRGFCAYGMEYKDQEGYTHDWVTLLPAVPLAYNTTIHPTPKDFHDMWKKACDTAAKCIAEAKDYNKQRENAVEVKLTEEFSRKNPVLPVSLVKPYFQTEEDKFHSRKKKPHPTRDSGSGRLPWASE
ncbi:hypothetical protein O181_041116 [Austropuccinia psidii MF-1]|uniref:Uncharacterized protein n=1 Tax=Austropuccinia psidii MF-1 TaxID=1389203 RepID=A0A9Q3HDZ7_9BASI|nr:hypothetical protein [Austropuccinia psidii MF-1]